MHIFAIHSTKTGLTQQAHLLKCRYFQLMKVICIVIIFFLSEFHYVKKSCKYSTFIVSPQYNATFGTACRIVSIMFHSLVHYLNIPVMAVEEQNVSILVQHEFINA